jgi:alpha-tubulin suppressor-like RCC1 family protein
MKRAAPLLLVFALGCSESGQVLGPAPESTTPLPPAPTAPAASRVVTGTDHSCALVAGAIYCWGSNEFGQLGAGDGNAAQQLLPVEIASEGRFTDLCAGNQHTCALTDLGQVQCWGNGPRGALGQGERESSARPIDVPLSGPATSVSCGFANACALLVGGELWCWGKNGEGELAQGDDYPGDANVQQVDMLSPVRVGTTAFRSVGPGDGHLCAVRADGTLWCSGRNTQHQLGPASARDQERTLLQLGTDRNWVQVVSGMELSCALRTDRSLWCWGTNTALGREEGAPLGLPGAEATTPTRVTDGEWLEVATNTFHTCALSSAQELWCWGRNAEGQLGLADRALRREPTSLGRRAISVDVNGFTTCAVNTSGTVACTGKNDHGELGTGNTERPFAFTDVVIDGPGSEL